MSRSASTAVAAVATPFQVAATRTRPLVHLRDLDIAPENLRFAEPPDEDIPLLAETLFAAGQLQPLTVRPGRKKEAAHMALDGRRRLMALRLLVEQGRIDGSFLVDVFVETDPARQAAAALLTNTAVPVHVADVISSIGRMLRGRLAVPVIARALGYAELDVKRLAALATLPSVALEALKAGRLNLRQAKLLARLPDKDEQAELARLALDGQGFQDWRIIEKLDDNQIAANDPRCTLVGEDRYGQAGGRTVNDLFGERPPVLLDPSILTEVWIRRAREIVLVFETENLEVHVTAGDSPNLPGDVERLGYIYGGALSAAEMTGYREARDRFHAQGEAVGILLAETTEAAAVDGPLIDLVRARIAMDQAGCGGRAATVLVVRPSRLSGIDIQCYAPVEPEPQVMSADEAPVDPAPPVYAAPEVEAPEPEVEGVNHVLHAMRTDVATRGLIRALADDPGVALTALIARLFNGLATRVYGARTEAALAVAVRAFQPTDGRVIEALDGEVRRRLDERRAAWEASGQTVIAWIHGLAHGDKMGLLAELTALTLDLREERTSQIRRRARAEAAELAALCGADITLHWTPDSEFLKPHSKPLLLDMLEAMGEQDDPRVSGLRKTDLIDWVAGRAAERVWAPASLSWTTAEAPDGDDPIADGPDAEDRSDGSGAFAVTAAGVAALERTA